MNAQQITSNQYYGALNRRFEARAKLLKRFGFKYERLESHAIAIFTRPSTRHTGRPPVTIPAAVVMHAPRRSWLDTLDHELRQ